MTFPVRAIGHDVLVDIYDDGDKTVMLGGKKFFLLDDSSFAKSSGDQKHPGIRPRWAVVLAAGPIAEETGIRVGQKVLCDTLKWSRGVVYDQKTRRKLWRIPAEDICGVDDAGLTAEDREQIDARYRGQ